MVKKKNLLKAFRPRKRKSKPRSQKNPHQGFCIRPEDGYFRHIFTSKQGDVVFNVISPGRFPNLSLKNGSSLLDEAIELALSRNRSRLLVIHGIATSWLRYLKANYDVHFWKKRNRGVSVLYLKEFRERI